jgi:glycosyltransferase involved in cell wall biosynthesis
VKDLSEMNEAGLVSVVIPTYNYAHFIGEAIESVRAQTYRNFEIIVVDDGSTDETEQVVSGFPRVRYLRQQNQGIAGARNTGLRASRGEMLVFLDADDRLLPDALEVGINCLTAHTDCAFVSGHWEFMTSDGHVYSSPAPVCIEKDHYRVLFDHNYIGTTGAVMFRREVFSAVGGFDPVPVGCDDLDLYMRIAREHPVACHDRIIVQHRIHGFNKSREKTLMIKSTLAVYRRQLKHVRGDQALESLCRERIKACRKLLRKSKLETIRKYLRNNKHLSWAYHRIRAEFVFQRYKLTQRAKGKAKQIPEE